MRCVCYNGCGAHITRTKSCCTGWRSMVVQSLRLWLTSWITVSSHLSATKMPTLGSWASLRSSARRNVQNLGGAVCDGDQLDHIMMSEMSSEMKRDVRCGGVVWRHNDIMMMSRSFLKHLVIPLLKRASWNEMFSAGIGWCDSENW